MFVGHGLHILFLIELAQSSKVTTLHEIFQILGFKVVFVLEILQLVKKLLAILLLFLLLHLFKLRKLSVLGLESPLSPKFF